eukprot:3448533-Amphidinium_carterae.1
MSTNFPTSYLIPNFFRKVLLNSCFGGVFLGRSFHKNHAEIVLPGQKDTQHEDREKNYHFVALSRSSRDLIVLLIRIFHARTYVANSYMLGQVVRTALILGPPQHRETKNDDQYNSKRKKNKKFQEHRYTSKYWKM